MKAEATLITTDDTAELSKLAANGMVRYIRKHPDATDAVLADMIQGTLDGFIAARSDNRKDSLEDVPGTGEMMDGDY